MDRISALRNIEESLAAFENGEQSLSALERDVRGILRTYATSFEEQTIYRAAGGERVDGLIVLAESPQKARQRVEELVADPPAFDVEPADEI